MRQSVFALGLAAIGAALVGVVVAGNNEPSAASPAAESSTGPTKTAIFAGGCFWCMEPPFDKLDGVLSTTSGYTAGKTDNPTYRQVSAGGTGHTEAVKVVFDPSRVNYQQLLDVFWVNVDPTVNDRQFCDKGAHYRPGIFYLDDEQKASAQASLKQIESTKSFSDPIRLEITAASKFYAAEDYHQDYYLKNPIRYKFYRTGCGRDKRLRELWGDKAG